MSENRKPQKEHVEKDSQTVVIDQQVREAPSDHVRVSFTYPDNGVRKMFRGKKHFAVVSPEIHALYKEKGII